jgi:hypothetical protein
MRAAWTAAWPELSFQMVRQATTLLFYLNLPLCSLPHATMQGAPLCFVKSKRIPEVGVKNAGQWNQISSQRHTHIGTDQKIFIVINFNKFIQGL